MNINKTMTILMLIFLLLLGVCGCANNTPEVSKSSCEETTAIEETVAETTQTTTIEETTAQPTEAVSVEVNETEAITETIFEEETVFVELTTEVYTELVEETQENEKIHYNIEELERIENNFLSSYTLDGRKIEQVYDSSQLSGEEVEGRNGRLIAERCVSIVTNAKNGDGKMLNPYYEEYDYISFKGCNLPYTDGTIIVTYEVYNPTTDWVDDIIDRYDFVLTREYED